MSFIQLLQVPFVSAFDVSRYADAAGLTITFTGSYYTLRSGSENFTSYPTGQGRYFISGSGFWGPGSGYTTSNNWYFLLTFDQDKTGIFPPVTGSGFVAFNSYFTYQTSGCLPNPSTSISFTGSGSEPYTGFYTSGYTGFSGTNQIGYTSAGPITTFSIPANPSFSNSQTINNLAYLSGFMDMTRATPLLNIYNSGFYTSGYSGYGSGLQFIGCPSGYAGGTTQFGGATPFTQILPTGTTNITFANGTLEVRFNTTNTYLSGAAPFADSTLANYYHGREALVANSVGANRVLGRGTGDGTGFNTIAYGQFGLTISGGTPNQMASGFITSNTILKTGQWYMVSVTSSGTIASMYINGVLDVTGDIGPNNASFFTFHISDTASEIGSYHGKPYYGIIDEVRIWDSLRTSGEIAGNWNKTVSPYTGNLAYLLRP